MPRFRATDTSYGDGLTLKEGKYRPVLGSTIPDDGLIDATAVARIVNREARDGARLNPRETLCVIFECARRGETDRSIGARFGLNSKAGAARICTIRTTHRIDSANRTYNPNELAAVLINTAARARASKAKLAQAGITERDAA